MLLNLGRDGGCQIGWQAGGNRWRMLNPSFACPSDRCFSVEVMKKRAYC